MRVSILINNYNYQSYVGQAVESALQQTHADVEVIVVDDGSLDGSLQVLERYRDRVAVIAKINGGQASAYNAGFAACSGALVLFLDADDWLYADAAERLVAAYHPKVSKLQFPLTLVNRDGVSLGRQTPREMSDRQALIQLLRFGAYNSPPGSGNAYCTEKLRTIMPIDESRWRIAADTVPISLAPLLGEIVSLPQPLGAYRLHKHDDSSLLMNNAPADLWDEYRRIEDTKAFITLSLGARGRTPPRPLLLAPWEARIATLVARFAPARGQHAARTRRRITLHALRSLWSWPTWPWTRKSLQTAWMILVLLLPLPLARRLARQHRAAVGAPSLAEPQPNRA